MLFQPDFFLFGAVGIILVASLIFLIWRSWHHEGTSPAEQRALLGVATNIALAPAFTFAVAVLAHPTLGILAGLTLIATVVSLVLLARIHGAALGHDGLFRRVRNLTLYYSYLFFLLSQFPKIHVTLAWYLADPGQAHVILLAALLIPGFVTLATARPSSEEWGKWWPIRQWSALFLILLLSLWMAVTLPR